MTTLGTTLGELMSTSPLAVDVHTSARLANHLANQRPVHHVLILEGSRVVGLTCVCDLANALDGDEVSSLMHDPPSPLTIDDSPDRVAHLMQTSGASCLPVVDGNGRLSGVVTRSDLRRTGYLTNERGVDVCAACGTSHHLVPRCRVETVFCADCLAQVHSSGVPKMYFTLGGGD
jgi:CBS domain-containing protein